MALLTQPKTRLIPAVANETSFGHFVVTDKRHIAQLVDFAKISFKNVVLDLGSGDGSFLRSIVRRTRCRGLGVEANPELHAKALQQSEKDIAAQRLCFVNLAAESLRVDFLVSGHIIFVDFGVKVRTSQLLVYMFALPFDSSNVQAAQLLRGLLDRNARVVTNTFPLPNEVLDCSITTDHWPRDDADAWVPRLGPQPLAQFHLYRHRRNGARTATAVVRKREQELLTLSQARHAVNRVADTEAEVQAEDELAVVGSGGGNCPPTRQ